MHIATVELVAGGACATRESAMYVLFKHGVCAASLDSSLMTTEAQKVQYLMLLRSRAMYVRS